MVGVEAVTPGDEPTTDPNTPGRSVVDPSGSPSTRGVSADRVVTLALVVVGLRLGLRPLSDNSFLTHLATGRIILAERRVPTVDPYSFTAPGRSWTVQSWLASTIYATAEKLGGLAAIRGLVALLTVALVLLVWRLTRPAGGLVARMVPIAFVVAIGTVFWSERPLLFGLVGLALVLLAADGELDPRWLVPVLWVWANTHGSFPFAPGLLVLLAVGRRLDRTSAAVELRALRWCLVGLAVAAVNPLGPKLLAFPLAMVDRREAFGYIVEWMPLRLDGPVAWAFLLQVVVAVGLVARRDRRWRSALPLVVFAGAAFLSRRNVAQASLVVAACMTGRLAGLGRIDGSARRAILRPVAVLLAAVAVLLAVGGLAGADTDLGKYPVAASTWMDDEGLLGTRSRVLAPDYAGNFLEARYGPDGVRVFIDDRVDMYPMPVIRDYVTLHRSSSAREFAAVVGRADPTVIVWTTDSAFGRWVSRTTEWTVLHRADGWLVAVPAH